MLERLIFVSCFLTGENEKEENVFSTKLLICKEQEEEWLQGTAYFKRSLFMPLYSELERNNIVEDMSAFLNHRGKLNHRVWEELIRLVDLWLLYSG